MSSNEIQPGRRPDVQASRTGAPVRLGHIDFLNSMPVMHGLMEGRVGTPFPLEVHAGAPAVLNRRLLAGELDVSPISTIEFARHADELALVPRVSINSRGFVDSVTLFHADPLDGVTDARIAVTDKAATSVALLKVLCRDWFGGEVTTEVTADPIAALDAGADAALLIGDRALTTQFDRPDLLRRDLGEAWTRRTGQPMVFAVWAARNDIALQRRRDIDVLQRALEASKAWGRTHFDLVVEAAADRSGLDAGIVAAYFRHLRFDLDAEALTGLRTFLHACVEAGELDVVPDLGVAATREAVA